MALPRTFEGLARYLRAAWRGDPVPNQVTAVRIESAEEAVVRDALRRLIDGANVMRDLLPDLPQITNRSKSAGSKESRARARALLLRFLTPKQREQFDNSNSFDHVGKYGTYTIRLGRSFNVQFEPHSPSVAHKFLDTTLPAVMCAIPIGAGEVPVEDIVLAQLLWLKHDEDDFWWRANRGPVDMPLPGRIWYEVEPGSFLWSDQSNPASFTGR